MLVFLSRREDRRVDHYQQRGLTLDRSGYQLGGGTRSWSEVDFDVERLQVADDGGDAEVRFSDVDGRVLHVHRAGTRPGSSWSLGCRASIPCGTRPAEAAGTSRSTVPV